VTDKVWGLLLVLDRRNITVTYLLPIVSDAGNTPCHCHCRLVLSPGTPPCCHATLSRRVSFSMRGGHAGDVEVVR